MSGTVLAVHRSTSHSFSKFAEDAITLVEGLGVATHVFEPYILPVTLVFLVGLFFLQSRGTAGVGSVFGH